MWFIGVEVEQESSAPPPKKKSWIRPYTAHLQTVPFQKRGRHILKNTMEPKIRWDKTSYYSRSDKN